MRICEMTIGDHAALLDLMRRTPEMQIREADSREATEKYLLRNPGLSFAAWDCDRLVGCALCGHDGRRGYLQHVIVDPEFRRRGIARDLIKRCLDELEKLGILKTHLDVFVSNDLANAYWLKEGWKRRDDIFRYSCNRSQNPNA